MIVEKFEYFNLEDQYDLQYDNWSRIYEYKFVMDFLLSENDIKNKSIHNSCWGYADIHK